MPDLLTPYRQYMGYTEKNRKKQKQIFDIIDSMKLDQPRLHETRSGRHHGNLDQDQMTSGEKQKILKEILLYLGEDDWDTLLELYFLFGAESKLDQIKDSFNKLEKEGKDACSGFDRILYEGKQNFEITLQEVKTARTKVGITEEMESRFKKKVRTARKKVKNNKELEISTSNKMVKITKEMGISTRDTSGNSITSPTELLKFLIQMLKSFKLDFLVQINTNYHLFDYIPPEALAIVGLSDNLVYRATWVYRAEPPPKKTREEMKEKTLPGVVKLIEIVYLFRKIQHIYTCTLKIFEILNHPVQKQKEIKDATRKLFVRKQKVDSILNSMYLKQSQTIDRDSFETYDPNRVILHRDRDTLEAYIHDDWDILVEIYHSFDWQSKLQTTENSFENLQKAVEEAFRQAETFRLDTTEIRSKMLEITKEMGISTVDTDGNTITKPRKLLKLLVAIINTLYLDFKKEIKKNKAFFKSIPRPHTIKQQVEEGIDNLIKNVYCFRKLQDLCTDALKLAEILVDYIDRLMAFAMIRHKRLGKDSPFRDMSDDITRIVTGH